MNTQPKVLPTYLNLQKIGASLKEVGSDYLKVESREVETKWFRDTSGEIDVFIWFNKEKKIIKQQVCIMGQIAEWNMVEGNKTGMLIEDEINKEDVKDQQTASERIVFDNVVQVSTLLTSISMVKNMDCLEEDLKRKVVGLYERGVPVSMRLLRMTRDATTEGPLRRFLHKIINWSKKLWS
jgi:hypothetical protein